MPLCDVELCVHTAAASITDPRRRVVEVRHLCDPHLQLWLAANPGCVFRPLTTRFRRDLATVLDVPDDYVANWIRPMQGRPKRPDSPYCLVPGCRRAWDCHGLCKACWTTARRLQVEDLAPKLAQDQPVETRIPWGWVPRLAPGVVDRERDLGGGVVVAAARRLATRVDPVEPSEATGVLLTDTEAAFVVWVPFRRPPVVVSMVALEGALQLVSDAPLEPWANGTCAPWPSVVHHRSALGPLSLFRQTWLAALFAHQVWSASPAGRSALSNSSPRTP